MSEKGDNSVIGKYTLKDKTLNISGIGGIKDKIPERYKIFIENIIIEEGVTEINFYAFLGCSNLEYIKVSENNKNYISENGILFNKEKTKILCYPAEKKDINEYKIPEGVIEIGSYAFYECSSLSSISIPESVTSIGDRAFYGCSSLSNISIPESITSIGETVFYGCSFRVNIKADSIVHKYFEENKIGYILDGKVTNTNTEYEIKEEVAFDLSEKEDNSVIGKYTLKDKTLKISGIGKIENKILEHYKSFIENIIIEEGVTEIGEGAFYRCTSLSSITIPESITSIGETVFECCYSLEWIKVSDKSKDYISENGILFNKEKTKILCYPARKKDINEYKIPKGVTSIGDYAFDGCSNLSNIIIPEGVTKIGWFAFAGCSSLSNITIPESVIIIEVGAFSGCSSLSNITISEGVTWIGMHAFSGCSNLSSIAIPKSVIGIENYAFSGCSSLSSVTISEGVTSIGSTVFSECNSLEDIKVSDKNKKYISENGILFNKVKTKILCYPAGKRECEEYIIPNGVTSIGDWAFEGYSNLTSIIIPESVTSIEEYAIENMLIYTKSNTEGHRYAEENKQGYIIDDVGPEVIIEPNGNTIPQRKYNVKVTAQDNIEEVGIKEKSLKYVWSQSETEPENISESFENGQTIEKNTGDGKWYLWVSAEDKLGNKTIKRSECFNFDNTVPNIEVKYSTKEMTKENVIVTLRANEQIQEVEGWTLSQDKKILTKEYRENAQEIITIKDLAGNEEQVNIEIKNIIIDIKIGDINNDKKIDITDLLLLKRHIIAGNKTEWQLKGNSLKAADVNEDGNVNITDMLMLKRKLININH